MRILRLDDKVERVSQLIAKCISFETIIRESSTYSDQLHREFKRTVDVDKRRVLKRKMVDNDKIICLFSFFNYGHLVVFWKKHKKRLKN